VTGLTALASRRPQIAVQVATPIRYLDITDAALESARELMAAGKRDE